MAVVRLTEAGDGQSFPLLLRDVLEIGFLRRLEGSQSAESLGGFLIVEDGDRILLAVFVQIGLGRIPP